MRRKHVVLYYCLLFLTLILTITSSSTYALNFPAGKEDLYIQNNILFYEPGEETRTFNNNGFVEDCNSYLNTTSFAGVKASGSGPSNTNAQYIVSKLVAAGYNNTAIAGIMGNLQAEDSQFIPEDVELQAGGRKAAPETGKIKEWSGYGKTGFGIVQWTSTGRQEGLDNFAVSTGRRLTDIDMQIEYMIKELSSTTYNASPTKLNAKSVEEATFHIYRYYEGPGSVVWTTHKDKYYNDYMPNKLSEIDEKRTPAAYKEFTTRRLAYAIAFYEALSGENYAVSIEQAPVDYTAYYECLEREKAASTVIVPDFNYDFPCKDSTEAGCDKLEDLVKLSQADKNFYKTQTETRKKHFDYLFQGSNYSYQRYKVWKTDSKGKRYQDEVGAVCLNGNCGEGEGVITKEVMEKNFLDTVEVDVYRGPQPFTNPGKASFRVHPRLAAETTYIFRLLFEMGFPVDTTSYAFRYGGMAGDSRHPTHHSYGAAFDINVYDNPWYDYNCQEYQSSKFGTYDSSSNCAWYNPANPKANNEKVQAIFRAFGYRWLGSSTATNGQLYDPMHFSYTQN